MDELFDDVREILPGAGHNRGPGSADAAYHALGETVADVPRWVSARHKEVIDRIKELSAVVVPKKLKSAEEADRASDLRKQITTALKAADTARAADKKAFDAVGQAIHGLWGKHAATLDAPLQAISDAIKAYLKEKEEKARAAAEKAAAKTGAEVVEPVKPVQLRGDYGSATTTVKVWTFKELDQATIDLEALRPYLTKDAVESAVRQYIRVGGRQLRGVTIFEDTQIRTR